MDCPIKLEDCGGSSSVFTLADSPDRFHEVEGELRCSYCGSLHPDKFMEYLKDGSVELEATTKDYKVYVKKGNMRYKFYFQHLSNEQCQDFINLYITDKLRMFMNFPFNPLPFFMIKRGA